MGNVGSCTVRAPPHLEPLLLLISPNYLNVLAVSPYRARRPPLPCCLSLLLSGHSLALLTNSTDIHPPTFAASALPQDPPFTLPLFSLAAVLTVVSLSGIRGMGILVRIFR